MAWTYTPDYTTQRDRVRLLIGDTDISAQLLSDAEIGVFGTGGAMAQSNDYYCAIACGRAILAKYSHTSADVSAGGTSVSLSQRVQHVKDMLPIWQQMAITQGGGASAYLGGSSIAAKADVEADEDRVEPAFTRTLGDPDDTSSIWEGR